MPRTVAIAILSASIIVAACGNSGDPAESTDRAEHGGDPLIHVHDVLVGPDGTPVFLAAHTGLYELHDGELIPRSDRFDDLMAAAIESDGTLIASGHPDLRTDDLRIDGKPPLLGLVESEDGSTWSPRSLLGDADFHALVIVGDQIFGADSTSSRVMVSDDGGLTWTARAGQAQLVDLAVDPGDLDQMVGVDLDRGLVRTGDGADRWEPVPDAPALVDLEWTTVALVALDTSGSVQRSTDGGRTWTPIDSPEGADALGSDGPDIYAFTPPAGLHVSNDGGESWRPVSP